MKRISKNGILIIGNYLLLTLLTHVVYVNLLTSSEHIIYDIVGSWATSILLGVLLVKYTSLKHKIFTKD